MIENLSDSFAKISKAFRSKELLGKQYLDTKNRIDGLLLSGSRNPDETRILSQKIFSMPPSDRKDFIISSLGPQYYSMIEPLLASLEAIEKSYSEDTP